MVARRLMFAVCAAAAVALSAAPAAPAAWHVRTLDQGRPAWLSGIASLPGGHTAYLVDERAGGTHRMVLQQPGRAARTLMTSAHTFEASLRADDHGHLAVAWSVIPDGARFRRAYVWTGGATRTLTDGTRHASVVLAVSPAGAIAVTVNDGTTSGSQSRSWVQRGSFRTGISTRREAMGGIQSPYPGALTLSTTGAAAVAGNLGSGPEGVAVAPNAGAAFGAAAVLAPVDVPTGQQVVPQGLSVAFGTAGEVLVAQATLMCTIGTGDLAGECGRLTGSVLRLWRWPAGAPGPRAPVTVKAPAFAQAQALTSSGGTIWLTWLEGSAYKPQTLAAARIGTTGLGTTRRLTLASDERVAGQMAAVVAAPAGALRFYLPAPGRPTSALDTVRLTSSGRFGARETVVRGAPYGAADTVVLPLAATGVVRDVTGWTSYDRVPVARLATP